MVNNEWYPLSQAHTFFPLSCNGQFFRHSFCHMPGVKFMVFFWVTGTHFFDNLWVPVCGNSRDLHSIFFYGFKSFLETSDLHGIRAWNLGAAYHFEVCNFLTLHIYKSVGAVFGTMTRRVTPAISTEDNFSWLHTAQHCILFFGPCLLNNWEHTLLPKCCVCVFAYCFEVHVLTKPFKFSKVNATEKHRRC